MLSESKWGPPLEEGLDQVGKTLVCQERSVDSEWRRHSGTCASQLVLFGEGFWPPSCQGRGPEAQEGLSDGPNQGCGRRAGFGGACLVTPWVRIRCWGRGRRRWESV